SGHSLAAGEREEIQHRLRLHWSHRRVGRRPSVRLVGNERPRQEPGRVRRECGAGEQGSSRDRSLRPRPNGRQGPPTCQPRPRHLPSAATHITKDPPPFLIVHGDADKTVPIAQSEKLTEALKKAGVEVTFITKKEAGHGGPAFQNDEMLKTYQDFFDKHLKK